MAGQPLRPASRFACPWIFCAPWGPASPPASGVRRRCWPLWAGRTFGIFSPVVPAGFPSVVSPSLCMFRGEPFFFFFLMSFYSSRMLMPPRCAGTVPQECPRCVLNFGPGSFNAWRQREQLLLGFMWNSPPFLFSVRKDRRGLLSSRPRVPCL